MSATAIWFSDESRLQQAKPDGFMVVFSFAADPPRKRIDSIQLNGSPRFVDLLFFFPKEGQLMFALK